jgi:hypothetical protein
MICVVVRSLALCRYLRIAIPALVLAGLPGTAGGQVHEHATLPHNIPDFRGQSGCETVTASRDYSSSTTVECLVIESGTTRVRAGATLTADTILVL